MTIKDCNAMQQIIACEGEFEIKEVDHVGTNLQLLPKLRFLKLENLPELMNFDYFSSNLETTSQGMCSQGNLDIHMPFFSYQVSFPNLEKLEFTHLPKLKEIWHHQPSLESFYNLEILEVFCCSCLLNLIPSYLIQRFNNLKKIHVYGCKVLEYTFDLQGLDENVEILPKLETLKLHKLPRLRYIICNEDKNDGMRCLFSSQTLMDFQNLKCLSIQDCAYENNEEGHVNTPIEDIVLFGEKVSFPNLEELKLVDLPKLKMIWHHQLSLEFFCKLRILSVHNCPCLVNLVPSHLIQSFQNLKEVNVYNCEALESVFDYRGFNGDGRILSKIEILTLKKLPKLRLIICNEDKNDNMSYLLSPSKFKDFYQLKELHIIDCGMLLDEEVSCPPNLEVLVLKSLPNLKEIDVGIFAKLKILRLEKLPRLRYTFASQSKNFHNLKGLHIIDCGMEAERDVSTPSNDVVLFNEKGDDVKSLFLLCGMLGYGDISLDLLFQYCMGLDLFDHMEPLEQATNKLVRLVEILKASGLLLDSHKDRHNFDEKRASSLLFMDANDKFVRMHGVVREVARAIASKDPHPFVVREDVGLGEWSETDESKRCTFISLNCRAVHELPQGLVCPELQFFLLHNNNPSLNIPNSFFEAMKKLKVLDLPKMCFTTLPSSFDSLANLQTLRLNGCKLVDIAVIGKLTKLQVLSLVGSRIQQLPNEMVQLTNLRLLDLNDCMFLKVIPRNILSSLSRLECLYMTSSFTQWAVEGESNACLSELNHLSYLTALDIHIPDANLLPKDTLVENLTRYAIFVGNFRRYERCCRTKRVLKLRKVNRSLHLGDGISKLMERSEELEFMELSGTKYVLHSSDRESFLELKHLEVSDSPEIHYIIDSKDQWFLQHGVFPSLESLVLNSLRNMEEIWCGPIPIGSFGNLKTLHVTFCGEMKFLFFLSTARGLSHLEEMTIADCNLMQQIIVYETESEIKEDGHAGTNLQLFPKLRSLKLSSLPQLINFSSELETTSSTTMRTNARLENSFFSHKVSFPNLEKLILNDLSKLKDIWHHQLLFGSFYNLQILRVYECPCLLNLVPSHLIHNFQNLKEMDVQDCELLEHVIVPQGIDENFEILLKLETLKLTNLPRLRWIEDGNDSMKYVSSPLTLMNIPNLKEVRIEDL
ncbi:hypothetical protein VitviT2T_021536 [Vitis vinifera]|uniref:Disease resistance protein At4g27190-like leucine-rich repeats domain-containing protein n=1 Tax=Vitis vinifera TaxID=29760 RepID=A0ABY9D795_VITVI|nr:hypothetical protein VitviT2T_021536 [Vitis vinifera]